MPINLSLTSLSLSSTSLTSSRSFLEKSLLSTVGHKATPGIQWTTLAWIAGAALAATIAIAIIVLVSRRPKSMEDGIAEFSRSLQAVAPVHRLPARYTGERYAGERSAGERSAGERSAGERSTADQRPHATRPSTPTEERGALRMRRGETESV